ncbi:deaminase domain-containing protein [Nostoc sp.]|uniref:deaminase domain-containing protein n=1 Tax=Nostoc sp. TaxID=1180 RepID=UPI003FA597CF
MPIQCSINTIFPCFGLPNRKILLQCKIELFTEREPCDSCEYVIKQFRQTFPNIRLNIHHGNIA